MVDRPQKFSSLCPTVYGFIPQTYCGVETAKLCMEATKLENVVGKILSCILHFTFFGIFFYVYVFFLLGKNEFLRKGDGDPLDCCVLSTRTITHGDLILTAVPIGGFRSKILISFFFFFSASS